MYHGIINVYKEAGFTSHDVVAKLRGILKQKKIGHTGTLDPEAVGVLPVCLGSGTKLCDLLTGKSKEYVAVLRLGISTDTQDLTGQIVSECGPVPEETRVAAAIHSFRGGYDQLPPMYSALKVNGKKLYELARAGKEVERTARAVIIEAIEILSMELPEVEIRVRCSKGTYIRTLCHDIGAALGCGGAMKSLKRTRSGDFAIEDALTLPQLQQLADEGRIGEVVKSVDEVFAGLPAREVDREFRKLLLNGNKLYPNQMKQEAVPAEAMPSGQDADVRVYDHNGRFYGIYRYHEADNVYIPVKMFISDDDEQIKKD